MTEPIKPALTPEKWREALRWAPQRVLCDFGPPVGVHYVEESVRHALAALALHGQPFGFAREDVATLRSWIWQDDAVGAGFAMRDRLVSLADRIAALLPPEPTP